MIESTAFVQVVVRIICLVSPLKSSSVASSACQESVTTSYMQQPYNDSEHYESFFKNVF